MKKPNDHKRPNTNSGAETRQRKRNYKYVWVSNPLIEIVDPLTKLKKTVALPIGKQYRKPKE